MLHGQARTDRGGHRLLDDHGGLASAGELGGFLDGSLLDAGDARRNGDDHPGLGPLALMHLLDEVAEHLLADLEVGDDAVLERSDRLDVGRCTADHPLGLEADSQGPAVVGVDRHHGRFVEDDALTTHIDEGVGGTEVDGHVATDHSTETRKQGVSHHGARAFVVGPRNEDGRKCAKP